MSKYEGSHLPRLSSQMLLAPERKWAPRMLLPGEIPIPLVLLQDPQFFTTEFANSVAQSAIQRLPDDLEMIRQTLERKERMRVENELLIRGAESFDPSNVSIYVRQSKEGNSISYRHGRVGISLDTAPTKRTVATREQDHPVKEQIWESYGWPSGSRSHRWREERMIAWNAFERIYFRNLAIAFTNEGIWKLDSQKLQDEPQTE